MVFEPPWLINTNHHTSRRSEHGSGDRRERGDPAEDLGRRVGGRRGDLRAVGHPYGQRRQLVLAARPRTKGCPNRGTPLNF